MSRGFLHEGAWRVATLLAPLRGAAASRANRGYRRFAPQPPATVCHAFGVDSSVVDASHVDSAGVDSAGVDSTGVDSMGVDFFGADASGADPCANPKDCQKVAGGHSEAETSGTGSSKCASIPQGCQNGLP